MDPRSKSDNQALVDCLKAQANSRLSYLSSNSIDIIADFLGLFENLMNRSDFDYIRDFLNELKNCQFLRDCFQLCICLGKNDLDLCLNQLNANKKTDPKSNGRYTKVLKNLFNFIIDSNHPANSFRKKDFLKSLSFLDEILKDRNLKLVQISYKTFKDNENDTDDDAEVEEEESNAKVHNGNQHTKIDWQALSKDLDVFITTKLDPNSVLNFEQLIKLERHLTSIANIQEGKYVIVYSKKMGKSVDL